MMKKAVRCALATAVFFSGLSFIGSKATAAIDLMANRQVVVLADTTLLNDYKNPESTVGTIAGMQMVEIACAPNESDCTASSAGKEYILIKTWMGDKWIEDDDKITGGGYWKTDRDITIVENTKLYDHPDVGVYNADGASSRTIAPQKAHVTAMYRYLPKGYVTGRAMVMAPIWYRISAEQLGDKWIVDPFIPEDIQTAEQPSDRVMKLTGNERLYDYPYEGADTGLKAAPGVVQAAARAAFNIKAQFYEWYKLELQDGTFRWIKTFPLSEPEAGPVMAFDLSNETITLRTATRYFDPDSAASPALQNWLQPGTYTADKINNGWARVQTPDGWKVVNLDRAPLERPHGITETQERVKLTPETKTYYFPLTGEVCHTAGTFNDQEALSFEKWTSPLGVNWYHISTYSGIVWVPETPIQE